jgi:ribosomal protein L37AE/L43A
MIEIIGEGCPECNEARPSKISNTPIWFECKTCGYFEDSFKGPATLSRQRDPNGPFTQYL